MVRKAVISDAAAIAALSVKLWSNNDYMEMVQEFDAYLHDCECALFLAFAGEIPIGFAQCQLRHDYVEGTDSSPVGYLEGIYVAESHRSQGFARQLLHACEDWARDMGCTEFASDCELTNTQSLAFHLNTGFSEANRIICFTKKL